MKHILFIGLIAILFSACKKDDDINYDVIDEQLITEYLKDNNLEAQKHKSGLYYHIIDEGTGDKVYPFAFVDITYTGKLLDGTIFESNKLTETPLHHLIKAWQIGIPMLRKGGKAILYCPSTLGYGGQASDKIPANSVLLFQVEVNDFK